MRLYDADEIAQVCKEKYQTKEVLARKFAMRAAPKKPRKPRAVAVRDDDEYDSNQLVCDRCGAKAAIECTEERCYRCCSDQFRYRHNARVF